MKGINTKPLPNKKLMRVKVFVSSFFLQFFKMHWKESGYLIKVFTILLGMLIVLGLVFFFYEKGIIELLRILKILN